MNGIGEKSFVEARCQQVSTCGKLVGSGKDILGTLRELQDLLELKFLTPKPGCSCSNDSFSTCNLYDFRPINRIPCLNSLICKNGMIVIIIIMIIMPVSLRCYENQIKQQEETVVGTVHSVYQQYLLLLLKLMFYEAFTVLGTVYMDYFI